MTKRSSLQAQSPSDGESASQDQIAVERVDSVSNGNLGPSQYTACDNTNDIGDTDLTIESRIEEEEDQEENEPVTLHQLAEKHD